MPSTESVPLLDVSALDVSFGTSRVVHEISFTVNRGETVAIVGESGSGKSTTVSAILGLLPGTGTVTGGSIRFDGTEIAGLSDKALRSIRGRRIGLVPQDPMSNLNPVLRIGDQVSEAVHAHKKVSRAEARSTALQALVAAELTDAPTRYRDFPHEFSGGMRQRVLIALGIVNAPDLLIADEPTSALDVTVQREILDRIDVLVQKTHTSVLLITHDLALAAERADRVIVMRDGQIVEQGPAREILHAPQHGYTKALIAAAPELSTGSLLPHAATGHGQPTIAVEGVSHDYHRGRTKVTRRGDPPVRALDEVSFELHPGRTLAIVGESGSGKSTAAWIALGLTQPTNGRVLFEGADIAQASRAQDREFRRAVQPIFQDPYAALDPLFTVERALEQPLRTLNPLGGRRRRARVRELLDQVALPTSVLSKHASELSGGQRQRVVIARALAVEPKIIICDEPVSALDVLVQAQVLQLLTRLQHELGLGFLFISHDLGVVERVAHDVIVMKRGQVVERGSTESVLRNPQHEYTRALIDAVPRPRV